MYHAIYERSRDGSIWGYSPEAPGAYGAGDTLEAACESLREGIETWTEVAASNGTPRPGSVVSIETIDLSRK